jgi:ribosomal protein S18 acetylase RimI-like enzyme
MEILNLNYLNTERMQQVERLLHVLSPSADHLDQDRLNTLLKDGRMQILVAEDENNNIVGILSLCICPTLAQDKLWIEDVVVDECCRGLGIGRQLVKAAVESARSNIRNATVYLTSNPTRKAARALYVSEGFEEYETGVFRLKIQ